MSEIINEEQMRRLYNVIVNPAAEEFAHHVIGILTEYLPPPADITLLGISVDQRDVYPNNYADLLYGALGAKGYTRYSAPLQLNGVSDIFKNLPPDVIEGKPTLVVEIHPSKIFGLYLVQLYQRGSPKPFYASPLPRPGSLWAYTEDKGIMELKKSV